MKKLFLLSFMAFLFKGHAQAYYVYSDGNSNSYTLDEKKLVYTPVNPEESSSGTYSGGKAKKTEITKDTFKNISKLLDRAMSEEEDLQNNREMGTAQIAKYSSKGKLKKKVILKANAAYKVKIEDVFQIDLK
ncbi:MAG: hypothetical protein IPJ32_12920 [Sphingobacteriaceae bacterium]|nr:hypothetical protein [Sphingobacteriaceae bacterium]